MKKGEYFTVQSERTGRAIAVVSGKGGVGKSTLACALGMQLAKQGKKILLIDADEGLSCLDIMLGVSENVLFNLSDILCDRCDFTAAVCHSDCGVDFIGAPSSFGETDPEKLKNLIDSLKKQYEYIFIDSTAGIGAGFRAAVHSVSEVIVVVSPDAVCIRDAARVNDLIDSMGEKSCRMVINRFDRRYLKRRDIRVIDSIIDDTGIQMLGIVPFDSMIMKKGKPLIKGKAARACGRIVKRICGMNIALKRISRI